MKAELRKPGSPHYLLTRGVGEYRLGLYESARETLERAAASPDDGVHTVRLLFLAMTYRQLGEPQIALESYEEALRRWQISYCRRSDLKSIRAEAEALVKSSAKPAE